MFLGGDDIVLQYEAVRQNILVYQTPGFDRGATYSKIVRQYLDFYPYQRDGFGGGLRESTVDASSRIPVLAVAQTEVRLRD